MRTAALAAISVVFLVVTFRRTDPGELGEHLSHILASGRYRYLLAAVAVDVLIVMARVWKWRFLLAPVRRVGLGSVFSAVTVGILSNNVLFLRMDELVRAYVLGRRENLKKGLVLGTIVVERSWDAGVILAMLGILSFAIGLPEDLLWTRVVMLGLLAASVAGLCAAVAFDDTFVRALSGALSLLSPRAAEKASAILKSFLDGVRVFPRTPRIFGLVCFSALEWLFEYWFVVLVAHAVGIALRPAHVLLYIAVSFISFAVPSSPSAVGTYHWLGSLALFPVEAADALRKCFVIVCHAMMVVPVSMIGLVCLWREGMSFAEVRRTRGVRQKP